MQRIALGIAYQGTHYYGFQSQKNVDTIQARLEQVLTQVADETIKLAVAGRTDAGVHATGQVVHFDTTAVRSDRAWILAANTYLPADIRVTWAKVVPATFHARFSATARQYRYLLYNHPMCHLAVGHAQVAWYRMPLDCAAMQAGANYLLGEHDFSAFRAPECQAKTTVRTVSLLTVKRYGHFIQLEIKANAFLHHMVRNIVGVLLAVGNGKQPASWVQQVLASKQRKYAGITAKASGLCLVAVDYPTEYELPAVATDFLCF